MVENRTALVTGAASGIGRETVRRLSANPQYDPIFAVDLDPSVYTTFPTTNFPAIVPIQVDLRRKKQIDAMIERVTESGRIDLVVNAAGVIIAGRKKPIYEYYRTTAGRQQMLNLWHTNEYAVAYIMQGVEAIMINQGGGTIINITSSKDYFPDPYRREYEKSKSRVERRSLSEAQRLGRDNIRVVVVKPGSTKTNIDKGVWIRGSNEKEAESVQGFNDWWRKTFGNDPRNVAEVIYEIAEGRIRGPRVHVGFDAKLGYFLNRTIPFWRQIFYAGAYSAYEIVKMGERLKGISKNDSVVDLSTINLGGDEVSEAWYEEIMAEQPKPRTPEVVTIDGQDFYRLCEGVSASVVQLQELGITFEILHAYISSKVAKLGGQTRLIQSCEPEADGDWQYRYVTEHQPDGDLIFSRESIAVGAEEIWDHYLTFAPVKQLQ